MRCSLGFILLSHRQPEQLLRLIGRLNRLFDYPPIVGHHDFGQCPLETGALPENVSFVIPSLSTQWGGFSAVEGVARALRQLNASNRAPDWFVLLSGSDYPIKPAAQVLQDLAASPFDAHIHHELIQPGRFERDWQRLCFNRYYQQAASSTSPFSTVLRCYAGEFWFCANRKAAEYILDFHQNDKYSLTSYYAKTPHPDESYFQCILANNISLKLSSNIFRYIDWGVDASPHPKTLSMEDFSKFMASDAHFARKFDIDHDAAVLDAIDAAVDRARARRGPP